MKLYRYTEKAKPQGLYPTKNRASKEKIHPRKDPSQIFPKLAKTSKDEVVDQRSPGTTCTPPQKQGNS